MEDRGEYDPPALRNWTFAREQGPPGQGGNADGGMIVWTNHDSDAAGGQQRIPEAILLETEIALMRNTPQVADYIRSMREPVKESGRRRRKGHGEDVNGGPPPPQMTMAGAIPPEDDGRHRRRRERGTSMGAGGEEGEKRRKRRSKRFDE